MKRFCCLTQTLSVSFFKNKKYSTNSFQFLSTPITTSVDESKETPPTKIDSNTIKHLERLSLVNFGDEHGVKIVEDAIRFADGLNNIDTSNVEPLVTVLENEPLYLREDVVEKDVTRGELLSHAAVSEEDYYVAPIGNIELISSDNFIENSISQPL